PVRCEDDLRPQAAHDGGNTAAVVGRIDQTAVGEVERFSETCTQEFGGCGGLYLAVVQSAARSHLTVGKADTGKSTFTREQQGGSADAPLDIVWVRTEKN